MSGQRPADGRWLALGFLLPAAAVMLLIVGLPLLLTVAASLTDLDQRRFVRDPEWLREEIGGQLLLLGEIAWLREREEWKRRALASGRPGKYLVAVTQQENVVRGADTRSGLGLLGLEVEGGLAGLFSRPPAPALASDSAGADLAAWLEPPVAGPAASATGVVVPSLLLARNARALAQLAAWQARAEGQLARLQQQLAHGGSHFVGLATFRRLLTGADGDFWRVLLQTVVWTAVNVSLHFALGLGLALLLNRRLPGTALYRTLLMVPWAIPSFVVAFSWRLLFNFPDGLLNRVLLTLHLPALNFLGDPALMLPSCILVNVWAGIPFMMITLLGGLQNIDDSYYEAADIDGATAWQQFRHITLPLLRPVAGVAVLLGLIWTFNMFNVIYLVTLGSEAVAKDILVTYAYRAFRVQGDYAAAASYAVLILSLLLVMAGTYRRMIAEPAGRKRG